jgi:ADP-dependent phosphofructokinase/glucokinase
MEAYHTYVNDLYQKDPSATPYRHMLGGFQLLQKLSEAEAKSRLSKMTHLWEKERALTGPKGEQHMYHVEFAHFSNLPSFELFEQFAVRNADSLGMNEVEMKLLLDFWSWKSSQQTEIFDINAEAVTKPSL